MLGLILTAALALTGAADRPNDGELLKADDCKYVPIVQTGGFDSEGTVSGRVVVFPPGCCDDVVFNMRAEAPTVHTRIRYCVTATCGSVSTTVYSQATTIPPGQAFELTYVPGAACDCVFEITLQVAIPIFNSWVWVPYEDIDGPCTYAINCNTQACP